MSARDEVLSSIRRSLGVTGTEAPRVAAVGERMARAPRGIIPQRGQVTGEARVKLFREQAEMVHATCAEVSHANEIPGEAARYLRDNNLPAVLRMGADARFAAMNWSATALAVTCGPSEGDDLNSVSYAFAGIAETGTLMLTAGADNPTTLNFLPDNHIAVIDEADIDGDYESAFARLRARYGKGQMPRVANLVTGPSRSGDIEQKLLLGAHGPRRLHIVIVRGGGATPSQS